MKEIFFQAEDLQEDLKKSIFFLKNDEGEINQRLTKILSIIRSNASQFDESCRCNIEWIGSQFASELSRLTNTRNKEKEEAIDTLCAMIYRFLLEFDLSSNFDLYSELRYFISYCQDHVSDFSVSTQSQIEYASKWMHIAITKKILNNKDIKEFIAQKDKYDEINSRIDDWDKGLKERESAVENLSNVLKNYEKAFNFVGLYQGFDDLHQSKLTEWRWSRFFTFLLGSLTILPMILRVYKFPEKNEININLMAYSINLIPYIALTLLILYFFRISYRIMDDLKSQILQIELRKALCQFVQSYTDFSSDASKKAPETLKKFESVIFSNIVSTSEKIPSTFDGIESIKNIISLVNKNSK